MIMWYTIIVALAILGTSLVVAAQDDPCAKYGLITALPGASCADIYNKNPTSRGRSGYYFLKTDDEVFTAYCDMELECGGIKGGWMRIADININKGDTCPSGWTKYSNSYCIGGSAAGCYSTHFSTNSTSYSKVCGKAVGYQKGTMDAFYPSAHAHGRVNDYTPITSSRSLDGVYVDGISITTGSPRNHVWTYAVGASDDYEPYAQLFNCPCAKYPGQALPTFVGTHYYCESGNTGIGEFATLFTNDPLWDGAGCGAENSCCYNVGMPWFFRQFPTTATGDIEVRICHDEAFSNEGVAVEEIQLYVQ